MFDTADLVTIIVMLIMAACGIFGLWLLPKAPNQNSDENREV